MNSAYIYSNMFKPSLFLMKASNDKNEAQDNPPKHMCNFGAQEYCRISRVVVSYYIGVETRNYQFQLINTTQIYHRLHPG